MSRLTLPCSSLTAPTCLETSTSQTMAPPTARTTCPSPIQKSCVANARHWSAYAPRRPSKCLAFRLCRSLHLHTTLIPCRQLIPVSQPNLIPEATEQLPKHEEYAHLFNERFRSIRNRPSSVGADNEDDETAWLESAVGNQGEDELDQIKPAKGKLTIQFGAR